MDAMTTAARPDGIDESGATRATVDLLGVLAYGELSAFDRLAEDARAAPTLSGRATLAGFNQNLVRASLSLLSMT